MPPTTKTYRPIGVTDLANHLDESCDCDRCNRSLRFVHVIEGPDGDIKHVGRRCAARLCHGYDAKTVETKLRNLHARRSRWLTRNWRQSANGNKWMQVPHDGKQIRVVVYHSKYRPTFRYLIVFSDNGRKVFSPGDHDSEKDCMLACFDHLAVLLGWA